MKKCLLLFAIIWMVQTSLKAQYVTIPDPEFRAFLMNKFSGCFNASNQLDTTCIALVSRINMTSFPNSSLVINLDGIQYFKNLQELDVSNTQITTLPAFRNPRLKTLELQNNISLTTLPVLPDSLTYLDASNCSLTGLPSTFPPGLNTLRVAGNYLFGISGSLPLSMYELDVSNNYQLSSLPAVPNLVILNVSYTMLFNVYLSPSLAYLDCSYTQIDIMSSPLPSTLNVLHCSNMYLTSLPILPNTLFELDCSYNPIPSLPLALPPQLNTLDIRGTNITCLPVLPQTMAYLWLDPNKVHCIPNSASGVQVNGNINYPICNVTNNSNGCLVFPTMQGYEFFDLNNNGVKDTGEYYRRYGRVSLSNGAFTFTTDSGYYRLGTDTIGLFLLTLPYQRFSMQYRQA